MRSDMAKVIVERPRVGGKGHKKGRPARELDENALHEGMRAPYVRHYNAKELNENLAPLLRFLNSRVGQLWDNVYSEICENIRVTNAVQDHIRVHVKQFVETATSVDKEGVIWINGYRPYPLAKDGFTRFYVDPRDGLLCRNPNHVSWTARQKEYRAQQESKRLETARSLPNGVEIRKHEGIWYAVELTPVPTPQLVTGWVDRKGNAHKVRQAVSVYDVLLKKFISETHGTYVCNKRQLSHQELKTYGVTND